MFKKSLLSVAVALTLSACGGSSGSGDDTSTAPTTPTTPTNQAPTGITLSETAVVENAAGAVVGDLAATDADSGDTHTFTVSDDHFEISGSQLKLKADTHLDFESVQEIPVTVQTTDSANNTFSQDFTVTVTDANVVVGELPSVYGEGLDSVSYSGQVARHLLINELNNYINSGLEADLNANTFTTQQEVEDRLLSYFSGDWELEVADRTLTTTASNVNLDTVQTKFGDTSTSSKDLIGKIAGNDETGQHKDWSTEFVAFGEKGSQSPQQLIEELLKEIAANVNEEHFVGNQRINTFGDVINFYQAADGRDLKQLVQKILLGSVAFSQGADDYLDDDTENKGLITDHTTNVEGKNYTNLEHQYDEGFGYFGAARDYLAYTDDEIAVKGGREDYQGMHDTNSDSMIDFNSEFNFGHSQNAAKRDRGTVDGAAPTNLTNDAMVAFIAGRKLLADTAGTALDAGQMLELQDFRDDALMAWEKSIAATAVHYVNDTLGDYENFGTDSFNYADLAKHWSELKGFVVSLQFNRRSPLTDEQHEQVNSLIKDAPVLTADAVAAYRTDLLAARDILRDAYQFNAENAANW